MVSGSPSRVVRAHSLRTELPDLVRVGLARRVLADQAVQPAFGQRVRYRGARAGDGIAPERMELFGSVLEGRTPLPALFGAPVDSVPGWRQVSSGQVPREVDVLHVGQVLQQPTQGDRRGADARAQAGRIEVGALPGQGGALPLQGAQQRRDLVSDGRRFRVALLVVMSHGREPTLRSRDVGPDGMSLAL